GRVTELRVSERAGASLRDVIKAAEREHVAIRRVSPGDLDREARGGVHQGVMANVRDAPSYRVEDLVGEAAGRQRVPLLVVPDGARGGGRGHRAAPPGEGAL